MSDYVPLPIKFRPQKFSDLVGQEATVRIIVNMISHNRIHPSLVFGGSRGTGKTSSARIIAKALNCGNRGSNGDPCDECESCRDILNERSLSVTELDAASHGNVDDVRRIKRELLYADLGGGYRIYVIDEAHSLSSKAWDAFLKLLEEPPPNVIFVFCTTEVHKIPETIISRSQQFTFSRMTLDHIQKRLQFICSSEQIQFESGVLEGISRNVNGGMRDAISLLDQLVSYASGDTITNDHLRRVVGAVNVEALFGIANSLFKCELESLFKFLHDVYSEISDVSAVIDDLIVFYRDAMFVKAEIPISDVQPEYYKSLVAFSQHVPLDYLSQCQYQLMQLHNQVCRTRLPARVVVDVGITKLMYGGVRPIETKPWVPPSSKKQVSREVLHPSEVAELLGGSILQM